MHDGQRTLALDRMRLAQIVLRVASAWKQTRNQLHHAQRYASRVGNALYRQIRSREVFELERPDGTSGRFYLAVLA